MKKKTLNPLIISFLLFFIFNLSCTKLDPVSLTKFGPMIEASNIGATSATIKGRFIDVGVGVTSYGHCWAINTEPTIANEKTTNNGVPSKQVDFTSDISGLEPGTKYFVRTYALTSSGAIYSTQESFSTIAAVGFPSVTTMIINSITHESASGGGNVTSEGNSEVTSRGVCWSTSQNPTISESKSTDGTGAGSFTSAITGLTANTIYYVRAYATNSSGTAYGLEESFTTMTSASTPTLTTTIVSAITPTTASSGGEITNNGGATVTARGVCWSASQNPTISDSKSTDGSGIGTYTSAIEGLSPNTTYYVRAYATNSAGTAYGAQVNFTTLPPIVVPTITTDAASAIMQTSAISGGNVTNDGGGAVTARGVCWSKLQNPTITDSITTDGSGNGSFVSSLTGLSESTTYYVRAYATNSAGIAYGEEVSFTTLDIITIGASYQGGLVAYILQPGDPGYVSGEKHGLIVAPGDQGANDPWGCYGTLITGADGSILGTGNQNTIDIMNGCSGLIAARLCGDLTLGGYSDWYLPSKDELDKVYRNRALLGGFANDLYWSSTESGSNNAFAQSFPDGTQNVYGKNTNVVVRAVRSF